MVFLFSDDASSLLNALAAEPGLKVTLKESNGKHWDVKFLYITKKPLKNE